MASVNGVPFASMNSGSTYIPVNDSGTFVDSGFYRSGVPTEENTILSYKDEYNRERLKLDSANDYYSFGYADATTTSASGGIAVSNNLGEAIIGCGMSSPSNGVFRASSANGGIWLGPYGVSWGVGFNTNTDSILIGSSLMSLGSYRNIIKWAQVNDELGNTYFIPLYA